MRLAEIPNVSQKVACSDAAAAAVDYVKWSNESVFFFFFKGVMLLRLIIGTSPCSRLLFFLSVESRTHSRAHGQEKPVRAVAAQAQPLAFSVAC